MKTEKEKILFEYMVLHCRCRDKAAWEQLIAVYEKRLYYFIRQIAGNHEDALNVLQDTWLKAYYSIHHLREPASLTPWLYTIARNLALKCIRSRPREIPLSERAEPDIDQVSDLHESYAAEDVHRGLRSLSVPHREALVLFYLEDFSLQEIADILKIPIGTVRSRLHYAKQALRAILEKENDNECQQRISR